MGSEIESISLWCDDLYFYKYTKEYKKSATEKSEMYYYFIVIMYNSNVLFLTTLLQFVRFL